MQGSIRKLIEDHKRLVLNLIGELVGYNPRINHGKDIGQVLDGYDLLFMICDILEERGLCEVEDEQITPYREERISSPTATGEEGRITRPVCELCGEDTQYCECEDTQ